MEHLSLSIRSLSIGHVLNSLEEYVVKCQLWGCRSEEWGEWAGKDKKTSKDTVLTGYYCWHWSQISRGLSEKPCGMPLRAVLLKDAWVGHLSTNFSPPRIEGQSSRWSHPTFWAKPLQRDVVSRLGAAHHSSTGVREWLMALGLGLHQQLLQIALTTEVLSSFPSAWFLTQINKLHQGKDNFSIFVSRVPSSARLVGYVEVSFPEWMN